MADSLEMLLELENFKFQADCRDTQFAMYTCKIGSNPLPPPPILTPPPPLIDIYDFPGKKEQLHLHKNHLGISVGIGYPYSRDPALAEILNGYQASMSESQLDALGIKPKKSIIDKTALQKLLNDSTIYYPSGEDNK